MEPWFDWHAWQVVAAANIIGAGNGLEVGRNLELLTIRGAEAEAEQALRLSNAAAGHYGLVTPGSTVTQVPTCPVYFSACHVPASELWVCFPHLNTFMSWGPVGVR